jgi:chromosome segregation ATPase
MNKFLAEIFPAQELPPGAQEGLPYWIFWLLLCVILLLLIFIFLRDKDMRRRLDNFFAQLKNKLVKMRLQKILSREKKKKKQFITDLGKTAWEADVPLDADNENVKELKDIERTIRTLEAEKKESLSKIQELSAELDERRKKQDEVIAGLEAEIKPIKDELNGLVESGTRLKNQISEHQDQISELTKKITKAKKESLNLEKKTDLNEENRRDLAGAIDLDIKNNQDKKVQLNQTITELTHQKQDMDKKIQIKQKEIEKLQDKISECEDIKKEEEKKFGAEIKEWEKNKDKIEDKIKKTSEQKEPLFHQLGHFINDARIDSKKLSLYYSKIDRTDKRRGELEKQIEQLSHPDTYKTAEADEKDNSDKKV